MLRSRKRSSIFVTGIALLFNTKIEVWYTTPYGGCIGGFCGLGWRFECRARGVRLEAVRAMATWWWLTCGRLEAKASSRHRRARDRRLARRKDELEVNAKEAMAREAARGNGCFFFLFLKPSTWGSFSSFLFYFFFCFFLCLDLVSSNLS